MSDASALALVSLLLVTGAAAVTDTRTGLIPNTLTLPVLVLAPPAHGFLGGPGALGASLMGVALCGAVPLVLFVRGGMGGGDVKLFAAIGALVGTGAGLQVQFSAYIVAVAAALAVLAMRGQLVSTLRRTLSMWPPARNASPVAREAPPPSRTSGPDGTGAHRQTEIRLGAPIFAAAVWLVGGALVG